MSMYWNRKKKWKTTNKFFLFI